MQISDSMPACLRNLLRAATDEAFSPRRCPDTKRSRESAPRPLRPLNYGKSDLHAIACCGLGAKSTRSQPDCCSDELLVGPVERARSRNFLLPLSVAFVGTGRTDRRCEGCLTAFEALDIGTLRLKLAVVVRVDPMVGRSFRRRLDRVRLELEAGVDLFEARVWPEAVCRECSVTSCSARAVSD
jgi:hypothetical protein